MQRISVLFAGLVFVFCSNGLAESGHTLTNEGLIKMAKADLGEQTIVETIVVAEKFDYDTSLEAKIALKEAGLTDKAIATMIRVASLPSRSVTEKPVVPTSEKADKWNGLEFGVSTRAEVLEKLGPPAKEEITDLKSYKVGPAFLDNVRNEKVFLALTYRPTKEESKAYREIIAFLKDDVILGLVLDSRKDARLDPQGLIYDFEGIEFHDFVSGWEEGASKGTGRYERLGDKVTINNYGMEYAVWGKSERSLVVLEVRQSKKKFLPELRDNILDKTDRRRPGKVHRVYFYSRILEPKANLAQN